MCCLRQILTNFSLKYSDCPVWKLSKLVDGRHKCFFLERPALVMPSGTSLTVLHGNYMSTTF